MKIAAGGTTARRSTYIILWFVCLTITMPDNCDVKYLWDFYNLNVQGTEMAKGMDTWQNHQEVVTILWTLYVWCINCMFLQINITICAIWFSPFSS